MKSNLGHYGLARWIRWSEQQAKTSFRSGIRTLEVYTFKDVQCVWFA